MKTKEQMKAKARELISKCKAAAERPGAYSFLPIGNLQEIQREFERESSDPRLLLKMAGALARLITESYAFSESPLGTELLDFADEICYQYDPRFRREGSGS